MTVAPEVFTAHPHLLRDRPPNRSFWTREAREHLLVIRESLNHVVDEAASGLLRISERDDEGRIHADTSCASIVLSGPCRAYARHHATITVTGLRGRNTRVSVPVYDWHPEVARPEEMTPLIEALARSAIDHVDALEMEHQDERGECRRWALVHLARLVHGGRIPAEARPPRLHLTAPADGRPAEMEITRADLGGGAASGMRYRSLDDRPVAPDMRHERGAYLNSRQTAEGRIHCLSAVVVTTSVTMRDLPDDPAEIVRLIRDPAVPEVEEAREGVATSRDDSDARKKTDR